MKIIFTIVYAIIIFFLIYTKFLIYPDNPPNLMNNEPSLGFFLFLMGISIIHLVGYYYIIKYIITYIFCDKNKRSNNEID